MFTHLKKGFLLDSLCSYERENSLKLISLKTKKKVLKAKARKKYFATFNEVKEKINTYARDVIIEGDLTPEDHPVFVPVVTGKYDKQSIAIAYPRSVYDRLSKKIVFENKKSRERFYEGVRRFLIRDILVGIAYEFYFAYEYPEYLSNIEKYKDNLLLLKDPDRAENFIEGFFRYNALVEPGYRYLRPPCSTEGENYALVFGFLNPIDANLYKKAILHENKAYEKRIRWPDFRSYYISVQMLPTSIKDFYNLDAEKKSKDYENKVINNIPVLIPEFTKYKSIKNKKIKGIPNFPKEMLSKEGFDGVPVYKTKPIEKRHLITEPVVKIKKKDLKKKTPVIRLNIKDFKRKTLFITLDKDEYKRLEKKDRKNLFFYKKETDFLDTFKNVFNERKQFCLEEVEELLKGIRKKIKTPRDMTSTLKFIEKNYESPHLMEQTSVYIDKVKRKQIDII